MNADLNEIFEAEAKALHVIAGSDPAQLNCPIVLAQRLGIAVRSTDGIGLPGAGFATPFDPRGAAIYLDDRKSSSRRRFCAAHELAEVVLERAGYVEPNREEMANRFGAAILLPRPAVVAALRSRPWRGLREFARQLDVSVACAAMRLGEATGDPVALVDRERVRLRGAPWPFNEAPERLALCRSLPSGAYRLRLERERVVVGAT